jgi:hypothetical protein
MAKGYTFLDIAKPASPTAAAVVGGSLAPNTTYYYRVMKVSPSASGGYYYGKSQMSDQFSVTTNSTDKTARIIFACPVNAGYQYRVWRSTSPTAIGSTYLGCLTLYPTDNLNNSGGVVTFDDNGTATIVGNTFAEINDQAHGILTLSGSTISDKFSIVDLYNADIANGWGVIQKLDVNTYKVNCTLKGHTGLYWEDKLKTIIFADWADLNYTNSVFNFGAISGSNYTSQGCEILITSSWSVALTMPTLYAYRTIFKYIYPVGIENGNLGLVSAGFNAGVVQDCQVDRFRGFYPYGGANCSMKNFTMSRFDNAFSNGSATFNNVRMLGGSRIWQIAGENQNIVARGVYSESTYAMLTIGANATSSLSTIDSQISQAILVNSASTGFRWYDKFSYTLTIFDELGNAISGANLKIYDKDSALVADTNSDGSGNFAEQVIIRRFFEVNGMTVLPENNRNPFTIIISKDGYETYKEIISYSASLAIIKTVSLKSAIAVRGAVGGILLKALDPAAGSASNMLKL